MIVMIVDFILHTEIPTDEEEQYADYNQDGMVNVIDVVVLVNAILI